MKNDLDRRAFLEQLGACTIGGTALSQLFRPHASAQGSTGYNADPGLPDAEKARAWSAPPRLANPNILLIMVDQMRWPQWLDTSQKAMLDQQILPNIFGRLRDNSYVFQQYYTAATVCTAARGTLLTGLYAPQTGVYVDGIEGLITATTPALVPAFPTWATAVAALNPAYANNCWWFGKWHLSACTTSTPLLAYGFNTRTYPGGAAGNPSPNGSANEGTNGGLFKTEVFASDAMIAGDFIGWLEGDSPSAGAPASPWCATVSLINPHDISDAPAWFQASPFPPAGVPIPPVYFPPPAFPPPGVPALYTSIPSPWNYENLQVVKNKPSLQYSYQNNGNYQDGAVTDWVQFLNLYYWLQSYVDQQVGLILNALEKSPYYENTVIIFASDHGEYAGSHGIHDKGSAVYDESIRVPLYVHFPSQIGNIAMPQMCSSVDFFGLMCDLATTGGGRWRQGPQAYPDLALRQSLWQFLYKHAPETRVAPTLGVPYIFHTCDANTATPHALKYHIVGLRTKINANNPSQPGAKLAIYSEWGTCTTVPDSTPPDHEFYDYNPLTTNNWKETGNDYFSTNQTTQATVAAYLSELGSWGPPATGLIASELAPPLAGTGTDGNPLTQAQAAALQNYFNFVYGKGTCTA
ncbi:MAG TPA: sulfatase-like hydrolase/transferase [Bryobacteraceae bacterium]|nr:sulfatase-like hydrolase/transferase [Bryobacteraceae bacterium]